jgi:hypothetical protein
MKKMISLKSILSNKEILTSFDTALIKGGAVTTTTTTTAVVTDDKRRPRPGGGASTQLVAG